MMGRAKPEAEQPCFDRGIASSNPCWGFLLRVEREGGRRLKSSRVESERRFAFQRQQSRETHF